MWFGNVPKITERDSDGNPGELGSITFQFHLPPPATTIKAPWELVQATGAEVCFEWVMERSRAWFWGWLMAREYEWIFKICLASTLVGCLSCSLEQEGLVFSTRLHLSVCRLEVVLVKFYDRICKLSSDLWHPCRAPFGLGEGRVWQSWCGGMPQGEGRMQRKGSRERPLLSEGILQSSLLHVSSLHSPQGCRLSNKSFAISSAQRSLAKISLSAETQLTRSAKRFGLRERQGQHDLDCVQIGMDLSSAEKWTVHLMLPTWVHGQHSTLQQQ